MPRLTCHIHPSLNEEIISRLNERRLSSVLSFVRTDPEILTKVSGLQFRHILQIRDKLVARFASKLESGNSLYERILSDTAILPTGIKNIDELLGGGLITGNIYEICGASSCGKSQLCMAAAAGVSANGSQNILYVDTKGDLSAHRLVALMPQGSDPGNALQRINMVSIRSAHQLLNCLRDCSRNNNRFKLIVLDSLAALFYQLTGEQQQNVVLLSSVCSMLQYIAQECFSTVLVTNVSTVWLGVDEEIRRNTLGKFWSHIPSTQLLMTRSTYNDFHVTITKSTMLPVNKSTVVSISDEGIK